MPSIGNCHALSRAGRHRAGRRDALPGRDRAPLDVLLVHHDAGTRVRLQASIELEGHTCRLAPDVREAWDLHRARRADVIVCAMDLPDGDGLWLCRRVRADEADLAEGAYTHFILLARPEAARSSGADAGVDDCLLEPVDATLLQARLASIARVSTVLHALAQQNTALRRDSEASFRLARVDPLTGIANRLRLSEDIAVLWAQARRYGRSCCAALCDVDWFKSYNDAYGHLAGDQVLRRVVRAIRGELRRSDVMYRYGGEEFLVLLPEESTGEAGAAMDRVRHAVEAMCIATPADRGVVTISVGVAAMGPRDEDPQRWLARADQALYAAKAKGRNRVEVVEAASKPRAS